MVLEIEVDIIEQQHRVSWVYEISGRLWQNRRIRPDNRHNGRTLLPKWWSDRASIAFASNPTDSIAWSVLAIAPARLCRQALGDPFGEDTREGTAVTSTAGACFCHLAHSTGGPLQKAQPVKAKNEHARKGRIASLVLGYLETPDRCVVSFAQSGQGPFLVRWCHSYHTNADRAFSFEKLPNDYALKVEAPFCQCRCAYAHVNMSPSPCFSSAHASFIHMLVGIREWTYSHPLPYRPMILGLCSGVAFLKAPRRLSDTRSCALVACQTDLP